MKTARILSIISLVLVAGCQATPSSNGDQNSSGRMASADVRIAWNLNTQPTEDEIPRTKLSLVVTGDVERSVDLGTYTGTDGGHPDVTDAIMTQTLWFAGGGDQFAVFYERSAGTEEAIVVKHRAVDEEQTADQPWETVTSIPVPAGALVRPTEAN